MANFNSVKDFGAVGDGIADDTAACQACINTGLDVFFPEGKYKVSTLTLKNQFQGAFGIAPNKSVIVGTASGTAVLNTTQFFQGTIKDLGITRPSPVAFQSGSHGLHVQDQGYVSTLQNLRVSNCDDGIYVGLTAGAWVVNCFAEQNAGAGFHLDAPNLLVTGCYANSNKYGYWATNNNAGGYFYDCTGYNNTTNNLRIEGSASLTMNDVFMRGFVSSYSNSHGVYIDSNGRNITFQDGFVEYAGTNPSTGTIVDQGAIGVFVTANNTNVNISNSIIYANAYNGMLINCNEFKVTGCQMATNNLANNGGVGLYVNGTHDFIIEGNDLGGKGSNGTNSYGLGIGSANLTRAVVSNNLVGGRVGGIYRGGGPINGVDTIFSNNAGDSIQAITPALPGNSVRITNTQGFDVNVYISGGNAAVYINEEATGLSTGTFTLRAGSTMVMFYSVAPTWHWMRS
ncbi:glycosyl hydrolase family 28-related protein [Pseudomonas sp. RC10]|uniref:right-handed parallel beta-helix repeat-containing protein n=1 Tax=Pseudomonas bambusae TaxID=3139142 RepID=UPI00313999F6